MIAAVKNMLTLLNFLWDKEAAVSAFLRNILELEERLGDNKIFKA